MANKSKSERQATQSEIGTESGNALQVTIVLDSGLFLTDEEANGYTYSEVGYFTPHIIVYRDGEAKEEIDAAAIGTDCRLVKVRKFDAGDKEIGGGIKFSQCLIKNLLRLHNLYGHIVLVDRPRLDCIFHFDSGHFCSSKVKMRDFKEVDGNTHQPTGLRKKVGPIAHDIVVHYEIGPGEKLKFIDDCDNELWSSDKHKTAKRIDIEILADNSTATLFYREGLKLRQLNYWLPNQGDPPPEWVHGGGGGTGGGD